MKSIKRKLILLEDSINHLKDEITNDKRDLINAKSEAAIATIKANIELKKKELIKLGRQYKKLLEIEKFEIQAEKERERLVRDSEGQGKE